MRLTDLNIKSHKPKTVSYRINDGGGLQLLITPSGGRLWRWRYYFHGKQQTLALGKYPAVSLAEARRKRDEARLLVAAGKHPTPHLATRSRPTRTPSPPRTAVPQIIITVRSAVVPEAAACAERHVHRTQPRGMPARTPTATERGRPSSLKARRGTPT